MRDLRRRVAPQLRYPRSVTQHSGAGCESWGFKETGRIAGLCIGYHGEAPCRWQERRRLGRVPFQLLQSSFHRRAPPTTNPGESGISEKSLHQVFVLSFPQKNPNTVLLSPLSLFPFDFGVRAVQSVQVIQHFHPLRLGTSRRSISQSIHFTIQLSKLLLLRVSFTEWSSLGSPLHSPKSVWLPLQDASLLRDRDRFIEGERERRESEFSSRFDWGPPYFASWVNFVFSFLSRNLDRFIFDCVTCPSFSIAALVRLPTPAKLLSPSVVVSCYYYSSFFFILFCC